jgi:hypothetical protein
VEIPFSRENGVKMTNMGLIAKFAWIALPALAGGGVLSQVSSHGTGINQGGKASGVLNVSLPVQSLTRHLLQNSVYKEGITSYYVNKYNYSENEVKEISKDLTNFVVDSSPQFQTLRNVSPELIGSMAKDLVNRFINESYYSVNTIFKERLMASAVCDLTLKYVKYDRTLENEIARISRNGPNEELTKLLKITKDPKYILSLSTPAAVCTGMSLVARNAARAIGLKCYYVNGVTRSSGKVNPHHVWLVFEQSDGHLVGADLSRFSDYNGGNPKGGTGRFLVMPVGEVETVAFMASSHGYNSRASLAQGDKQNYYLLTELRFEDWYNLNVSSFNELISNFRIFNAKR